jgi:hypothetical protein
MVVGWSVNGSLTAQLVQPLLSASLMLVRATTISPTAATAANSPLGRPAGTLWGDG